MDVFAFNPRNYPLITNSVSYNGKTYPISNPEIGLAALLTSGEQYVRVNVPHRLLKNANGVFRYDLRRHADILEGYVFNESVPSKIIIRDTQRPENTVMYTNIYRDFFPGKYLVPLVCAIATSLSIEFIFDENIPSVEFTSIEGWFDDSSRKIFGNTPHTIEYSFGGRNYQITSKAIVEFRYTN